MNANLKNPISLDQLAGQIIGICRREDAAVYESLAFISDFDLRQGFKEWGCADCAGWLVLKCEMGRSTAKDRVRVATSLRLLPQIEEALRKGDLSYSKVRALTRVATEDNETWLLAQAFDHSAAQLERWVRRIRNGDLERSGADALRAYERRHLSLYVRDDGVGCITVELAEEDLELIKQALEFVSSSLPKLDGQSIQARQANALVQMARDILRGGGDAGHAGDNYQVVVHVDESALKGHGGESDLPLETVRRLACDGSVVALLKNHAGEPLSIGRKQRAIPTAMRRALEGRDRTCRFPGCGHDKWLHGHHIKHWALGGETSLRNLLLLCGHHHRLVHEGGFQIKRASSGEHYFAKPDGKPMDGIIFRGR